MAFLGSALSAAKPSSAKVFSLQLNFFPRRIVIIKRLPTWYAKELLKITRTV